VSQNWSSLRLREVSSNINMNNFHDDLRNIENNSHSPVMFVMSQWWPFSLTLYRWRKEQVKVKYLILILLLPCHIPKEFTTNLPKCLWALQQYNNSLNNISAYVLFIFQILLIPCCSLNISWMQSYCYVVWFFFVVVFVIPSFLLLSVAHSTSIPVSLFCRY